MPEFRGSLCLEVSWFLVPERFLASYSLLCASYCACRQWVEAKVAQLLGAPEPSVTTFIMDIIGAVSASHRARTFTALKWGAKCGYIHHGHHPWGGEVSVCPSLLAALPAD